MILSFPCLAPRRLWMLGPAFVFLLTLVVTNTRAAEKIVVEPEKGPNGGRLLRDGDLAVEVTIFERGVPPEFRVFVSAANKPLDLATVLVTIDLRRLHGRVDSIAFQKAGAYLRGDKEVEEPHSFDVVVSAERDGKKSTWTYPSYEGRTQIAAAEAAEAGIGVELAGPAKLQIKLPLNGRIIQDNEERVHLSARYPGLVKDVRKRLGDTVKKGELLAVVESNASLQPYEVRAPINGTIIEKDVATGEFVSEKDELFVLADMGKLLVDLFVTREDFPKIHIGQRLTIDRGQGQPSIETKLTYVSPVGSAASQSLLVRAPLVNASRDLVPGIYVRGDVTVAEVEVPLAVKKVALQTYRDWDVVFTQDGDLYEIRPLELGRQDAQWAEVVKGIEPGQKYVTANSFIVKADVGKSGASHDH